MIIPNESAKNSINPKIASGATLEAVSFTERNLWAFSFCSVLPIDLECGYFKEPGDSGFRVASADSVNERRAPAGGKKV